MDLMYATGQALGSIAFIVGMVGFYQKNDSQLLLWTIICNVIFVLHYLALGATSSAVMVLLVVLRLLIARFYPSELWLYILSLMTIFQFYFLGDMIEIFTLVATLLGNYVYFTLKGLHMRLGLFVVQLLWVPVSIYYDAYFALAFNVVMAVITIHSAYSIKKMSGQGWLGKEVDVI